MSRIRTYKPEFWTSESNGRLSRDARLIFLGLITLADDEGRFPASLRGLLASILPFDRDGVRVLLNALPELLRERKLVLYRCRDSTFGVLTGWSTHQRISHAAKSKLPSPDDHDSSPINSPEDLRSASGMKRRTSGRIRDQGSGIRDQGSGSGDRDNPPEKLKKKPRPIQPEFPAVEPAPPPTSRSLSRQQKLFEIFKERRAHVYAVAQNAGDVSKFEADDEFTPQFINAALKPILEACGDSPARVEDLIDGYMESKIGADKKPMFPFRFFVSEWGWPKIKSAIDAEIAAAPPPPVVRTKPSKPQSLSLDAGGDTGDF